MQTFPSVLALLFVAALAFAVVQPSSGADERISPQGFVNLPGLRDIPSPYNPLGAMRGPLRYVAPHRAHLVYQGLGRNTWERPGQPTRYREPWVYKEPTPASKPHWTSKKETSSGPAANQNRRGHWYN